MRRQRQLFIRDSFFFLFFICILYIASPPLPHLDLEDLLPGGHHVEGALVLVHKGRPRRASQHIDLISQIQR